MEQYLEILLNMPLFQGIESKKDLAWVLSCTDGAIKEYKAGETIYKEGDDVYFAGMVVSGILHFTRQEEEPPDAIDAGDLIPIPWSGEKSVRAEAAVTAKTDCKILFLRWIRLMKLCNFECAFHKRLIENVESLMAK